MQMQAILKKEFEMSKTSKFPNNPFPPTTSSRIITLNEAKCT